MHATTRPRKSSTTKARSSTVTKPPRETYEPGSTIRRTGYVVLVYGKNGVKSLTDSVGNDFETFELLTAEGARFRAGAFNKYFRLGSCAIIHEAVAEIRIGRESQGGAR